MVLFLMIAMLADVTEASFHEPLETFRRAFWKSALKYVNGSGLNNAELVLRNKNITFIQAGIPSIMEEFMSINIVNKKYGNHARTKQISIVR